MINLDNLPPAARRKIGDLERQADDLAVLAQAARAAAERADAEKGALLSRREADPDRAAAIDAEIEALNSEVARLRQIQALRFARAATARQVLAQIQDWMARTSPKAAFEMAPSPTTTASLEQVRYDIADAAGLLDTAFKAGLPKDELKAMTRDLIDRLAASGTPRLRNERGEAEWLFADPKMDPRAALATLAWIHGDVMFARLEKVIDARPDGFALPAKEREARMAELSSRILELERQEEALVAERPELDRRPDADPLAILGIAPVGRRAAAA